MSGALVLLAVTMLGGFGLGWSLGVAGASMSVANACSVLYGLGVGVVAVMVL